MTLDGPLTPGTDFDRLSVVARLAEDGTPLSVEVFEGESLENWPVSLNLLSGPGTPRGTRVEVFATAELAGVVRSVARGEAELSGGDGGRLALILAPLPEEPGSAGTQEVCSNGVDDDADGRADCADPQCEEQSCTASGGLVCAAGACGCPAGVVGVYAFREGFPALVSPQLAPVPSGARAGQVAIAASPVSSVTFFDPIALRLDSVGTVQTRAAPSLAVLGDGRVMVIGGEGETSFETLAPTGSEFLTQPLEGLTAEGASALGLIDRVILAGGSLVLNGATPGVVSLSAEGRSTALGTPAASCVQSIARLGAEAGVIAGGCPTAPASGTTIVTAQGLQSGPELPLALGAPALASLRGQRVLIAGGTVSAGVGSARAFLLERFGEGTSSVRELPSLPEPMLEPVAATLPNGWVFLADRMSAQAAWFDPAAERFVRAPALAERRTDFGLVGLGNNGALIVGGRVEGTPSTRAIIASPSCP